MPDPGYRTLDTGRLGRIAGWMQSYVDRRRYAGSSVLVSQGGHEVFFHTAGQRSIENQLPFTRDTLVRIYSMTKPVTSLAVMMLAERGLFHLDAPVSTFLPSFSDMQALVPGASAIDQTEPAPSPTLHQLLTHTAGLSYPFNPGVLARAMEEQDLLFKPGQGALADMADKVAALPLAFQPGSRWEYSVSIDILGRVVEVVSGRTLAQFFQDEIFAPLGMTETGFSVPQGAGDRFASLYTPLAGDAMALNDAHSGGDTLRLFDEAGNSPFETASMYSGGGGLVSSIDDYRRFAEMLRRGGAVDGHRLIGPATLDFMMRNHLPGDIASMGPQSFAEQPMDGMGFGLGGAVVLDPARARTPGSIGDFSWGGMASTFFWLDRVNDLTVVFFTQLSPSSAYPSRSELKALIHGALCG
ncbi:beta-lactamase family protein [Ruegeria pomeroyi]|uniref:Beta-lactamase n=2 Tax=Ruegeria pomeroyi TaxID=89184 RepID=Q5LS10_RUEPO|nr:serine hydrolase domain-containing protein [Ruegeria pomeroyi]AAV95236.1 beta-lactamase [Ruegeria pomeroyi DSS-3]NVK97412.1 beta-lactamase family protein [Ruegeria pomeroyi]NVL01646.1 beta-lactamase family protein [Ruegeria pomeroyi]QWV08810.1 beta-lactamase family protein [Ruegeria pomeroyi]